MAVHPGIIPGWPCYLGIPGYLDKGGYMAVLPGIILGWPGYLGNLGYLDKGGVCGLFLHVTCTSNDIIPHHCSAGKAARACGLALLDRTSVYI